GRRHAAHQYPARRGGGRAARSHLSTARGFATLWRGGNRSARATLHARLPRPVPVRGDTRAQSVSGSARAARRSRSPSLVRVRDHGRHLPGLARRGGGSRARDHGGRAAPGAPPQAGPRHAPLVGNPHGGLALSGYPILASGFGLQASGKTGTCTPPSLVVLRPEARRLKSEVFSQCQLLLLFFVPHAPPRRQPLADLLFVAALGWLVVAAAAQRRG